MAPIPMDPVPGSRRRLAIERSGCGFRQRVQPVVRVAHVVHGTGDRLLVPAPLAIAVGTLPGHHAGLSMGERRKGEVAPLDGQVVDLEPAPDGDRRLPAVGVDDHVVRERLARRGDDPGVLRVSRREAEMGEDDVVGASSHRHEPGPARRGPGDPQPALDRTGRTERERDAPQEMVSRRKRGEQPLEAGTMAGTRRPRISRWSRSRQSKGPHRHGQCPACLAWHLVPPSLRLSVSRPASQAARNGLASRYGISCAATARGCRPHGPETAPAPAPKHPAVGR